MSRRTVHNFGRGVSPIAGTLSAIDALRKWLIPEGKGAGKWHVSAPVDLLGYAWSWLPVFVPLLFLPGDRPARDYVWLFVITIVVTDIHRHASLPYVYGDRQVFDQHRRRFVVVPIVVVLAWVGALALRVYSPHAWIFAVIAVIVAVWNIWHVLMQKYGILRLYNAKSGHKPGVPGWADRMMLLSWLPLWIVWITPQYFELAKRALRGAAGLLEPIHWVVDVAFPVLLPLTIAFVLISIGLVVFFEKKVNGFRNAPRLWMLAGTIGLASTFLFMHPIKAYVCWGFSHAIEYMVFVWAFQRRRYERPLAHDPALGRVLRKHPWWAYLGFLAVTIVIFFGYRHVGYLVFKDAPRLAILGLDTNVLITQWGVYQAMMHFYYDGFLWKMRLPSVHKHI